MKAQSEASDIKTPLIVDEALPSLVVFGLVPWSSDKSPVNLGHTGTVTNKQHSLCVLQHLLAASPSSGCEKWVYSSGSMLKILPKKCSQLSFKLTSYIIIVEFCFCFFEGKKKLLLRCICK